MNTLNPDIPIYYRSDNLKVLEDELNPNFSPSHVIELLPLIKMKEVTFLSAGEEICTCLCLTPTNKLVEWKMFRNGFGDFRSIPGTYNPLIPGIPEELKIYKQGII